MIATEIYKIRNTKITFPTWPARLKGAVQMKKLVAILICVTLLNVAGCMNGYVLNGMKVVDEKICPTMGMVNEAIIASGYLLGYPQYAVAYAVFSFIAKGGCATNKQILAALLDYNKVPVEVKGVGHVKPALPLLWAAVK